MQQARSHSDVMHQPPASSSGASGSSARLHRGLALGTAPVFLASISTILGAIMFLRFGYAVGHTGLVGALMIIVLGHLVTVPTALAIAEIATNRRVEGGGEYFIISRSFGTTIGGTIGTALYLSQAISIAFYMIAFAEAFRWAEPWLISNLGVGFDPRFVSLPATAALLWLVLARGATMGVAALWVVVSILAVSLTLFFLGRPPEGVQIEELPLLARIADADPFMVVFAICFPAFTGMTAGVGLSGDLARPSRSIPLGVLSATFVGIVVYIALVVKLAASAPPEMLAGDQLVMSRIALWGPIIPIGLACATLSSAIGSIMVAPRTLQALAGDRILPTTRLNYVLSRGLSGTNEPRNATLVTGVLALITVAAGSVDSVARMISMFFMVTYGALCTISFLEHFAARPSYRPAFRTKWYLSFLGAVMCLFLMFQMDPLFALLALLVMAGLYQGIALSHGDRVNDLAAIFRGVMTQLTRRMQVRLQHAHSRSLSTDWRPSVIMVDGRTFERQAPLRFLGWLCWRHGFGTYLHFIHGPLTRETYRQSREALTRLVRLTDTGRSAIYVDTMISPSMRSALAQSLQVPGVSGMENNTILFELMADDAEDVKYEVLDGNQLASVTGMNSLILRHGTNNFGRGRAIDLWVRGDDENNPRLMILLSFILLGHPEWRRGRIRLFAAVPRESVDEHTTRLRTMLAEGRIPISEKNVQILAVEDEDEFDSLVEKESQDSDLVMFGLTDERITRDGARAFLRHEFASEALFVTAREQILIE